MATYTWNPNDVNVNTNPIGNGWTMRCNTYSTSSVIETTTPIGGRAWRYASTASEAYRVALFGDYAGGTENQEILMLFRRSGSSSEVGGVFRVATSGNGNAIFTGVRNNTTDFRWRHVDNCATGSGTTNTHGITTTVDAWLWVRSRVVGTGAVYVRVWEDGDPEPTAWGIESTGLTLSYSSGGLGIAGYEGTTEVNVDIAWWSAGTGTDEAPSPPPDVNVPTNLNAEQITATSARLTWDYEA
jgi:hypothetical protein